MPDSLKPRKGLSLALSLLLAAALAAAMTCYAVVFLNWGAYERFYPPAIAAVLTPLAALAFMAARAAGARRGRLALHTVTAVLVFAAVLFGVSGVVNNLLHSGVKLAVFTSFPLCGMLALWLLAKALAPKWRPRWRKPAAGILALAVLCAAGVVQYRHVHLPLARPVFSTPDLAQDATRSPGTNEFTLAEARTFNTALIVEKGDARRYYFWDSHWDSALHKGETASFRLEAFVDGDWQLVHRGQTMGVQRLCSFDAVTADRVRVVAEAADGRPVQIKSLALYNEPKRGAPGFHASVYFPMAYDRSPRDILDQGEEYARRYARWFDVYDTVICIFGVWPDENGGLYYVESEADYERRVQGLKELIALRGNPNHEVKLLFSILVQKTSEELELILRDHMDELLESIQGVVKKYGFDGVDIDYEVPETIAQWKRYDDFMARLDDGMKESNPDAILSAALFSWGMGMSKETLERLDQIQYMDYCEPHNALAMPTLEGMQRNVARIVKAGADPAKVQIGLGTHGYDRGVNWLDLKNANYWDCIYTENKVGCSPALAGDATAYALFSGLGGVMLFHAPGDRMMDDPVSVTGGIERALNRYVTAW